MTFQLSSLVLWTGPVTLVLAMTACSSGSGGDAVIVPPPPLPPPVTRKGIEGGGIVNRFGSSFRSITIGDFIYDASDASLIVTIDDEPAALSDLNIGNVVRVSATTDDDGVTAVAATIDQINDLEGPITAGSIDLDGATFGVLGQTVRIVATTIFDDGITPGSLAGLADGDDVEVSVLDDGTGVLVATRIERDDDAGDFEITGTVSLLDTSTFKFNLGLLVVDYASAALDDFDNGIITDGDVVEVEGDALNGSGELVAMSVENESPSFSGDSGDFGELEGFVTRFVSATDFDLDGFPVTTNAQTIFEGGVAGDLALGVRAGVDGVLDASGVLVANEVEIKDREDDAQIEVEAIVDAVDTTASTLTVLGRSILITSSTALEDDSLAELSPFSLGDIVVGDFVEIKAYIDATASNQLVAVQLKRDEDEDGEVQVEGPISEVMQPQITVIGIAVMTLDSTEFELQENLSVSAAVFFAAAGIGDSVTVEGTWDGATLTAREIELDD